LIIHTDYNGLGKLQYLFGKQESAAILNTEYGADVLLTILVAAEECDRIAKEVTEQTNGAAELEWAEEIVYAVIGKDVTIFEKI